MSKSGTRRRLAAWLWPIWLALAGAAAAQQDAAAGGDGSESFEAVLSAVVGVEAIVPATARTAKFLGTERRGSGAVIDAAGLVVTVGYVILEASQVRLRLEDGTAVAAGVVGYDHDTGFGLLRAARALPVTPLAFGAAPAERQRVLVAAHGDVRPAMVSSRRDFAGYWEYLLEDAIFTVPPHPNFGGAALLDAEGRLLGIGSLSVSDAYRDEEMTIPGNMFIPIDRLEPIIGDLLSAGRGSVRKPWLGLYIEQRGDYLFITRVAEDSPAAAAGLRQGELIVGVDGRSAATLAALYRQIWAADGIGVEITVTVLRDGRLVEVGVTSADRYDWLRLLPSV